MQLSTTFDSTKPADNVAVADEALKLYRDNEASSEMAYKIWAPSIASWTRR